MEKIYVFMLEYINILTIAMNRGYSISDSKLRVLQYKDLIKQGACSGNIEPIMQKACERLYKSLADTNVFIQDKNILQYLGITENPAIVLHDKYLGERHLTGYIACFTDKVTDKARYEPVWFTVGLSYESALRRVRHQFEGCYYPPDGLRLEKAIEKNERRYLYRGLLYNISIEKGETI